MTKRIAGFAALAAAGAVLALPAAPAHACFTPRQCITGLLEEVAVQEICVIRDDTTGTYVCV